METGIIFRRGPASSVLALDQENLLLMTEHLGLMRNLTKEWTCN